jgi:hypothetical protein
VARAERAEQNRNLILATQLGRKIAARAEHAEQNRSWESDSRKIATQIPAKDNHSDQSGSNGSVWGSWDQRAWEARVGRTWVNYCVWGRAQARYVGHAGGRWLGWLSVSGSVEVVRGDCSLVYHSR